MWLLRSNGVLAFRLIGVGLKRGEISARTAPVSGAYGNPLDWIFECSQPLHLLKWIAGTTQHNINC